MAKSAAQKAAEAAKAAAARAAAAHAKAVNLAKAADKSTAPAAAPAPAAAAAAPAAAQKPVDPFFTPDDILAMNSWLNGVDDQRAIGESSLTTARSDTGFQIGQLKDQAAKASSSAQDDAISRGIFQSSVKDATLFDIEAQRATQQGYLNDRLATATTDHDAWVTKYGGVLSNGTKVEKGTAVLQFEQDWAGKAKANAQAINDTIPAAPVAAAPVAQAGTAAGIAAPPTKGTPTPLPAGGSSATVPTGLGGTPPTKGIGAPENKPYTEVAGVNSAGEPGVWHIYSDGRPKVFVKRSGGMTP